ncbi:unnamed protein product, partial [Ectocarpus fasciculatus]
WRNGVAFRTTCSLRARFSAQGVDFEGLAVCVLWRRPLRRRRGPVPLGDGVTWRLTVAARSPWPLSETPAYVVKRFMLCPYVHCSRSSERVFIVNADAVELPGTPVSCESKYSVPLLLVCYVACFPAI